MGCFAQGSSVAAGRGRSQRSTLRLFAAGRDSHCSVHRNTVLKLARAYRSPLLFCDLEVRTGPGSCFEDPEYRGSGVLEPVDPSDLRVEFRGPVNLGEKNLFYFTDL